MSKILSSMIAIAFLITLSYVSTIYIFLNIQDGFTKLSDLSRQANRTTNLRASTLLYIQKPSIDGLQSIQKLYVEWLRYNQLTGYPENVQNDIDTRNAAATGIEQYELQIFSNPAQSLYIRYVDYIGQYNTIINSASVTLIEYLNAKIAILYYTLTGIYIVNIAALVAEYFYVRQPAKNVIRAGDTTNRRTTRLLEVDPKRPPPDSPGSSH